jgi:hypothetical protein
MARAKRERPPDPDRLIRRAAGDLHTEDGRFEVSSTGGAGRWYVTDTERHDGLGLALVLGPFGTLDEVKAAITGQRSEPAGADGPLPQPEAAPASTREPASGRRPAPTRKPKPDPEPRPEPSPQPEPEPEPRPPVRVTHARWRARGDDRDRVVEAMRRVIEASLSDDPSSAREDLHDALVETRGSGERLEGRRAVLEAWTRAAADAPATAWGDRELAVDVVGASAVVRYAYELEREVEGVSTAEHGRELWVLTREGDRWLAAYRTTMPEAAGEA